MSAICKSCQRPIRWIKTLRGNSMPVDDKIVTVITIDGAVVKGWQSHFASCPAADQYRRHKDGEKNLQRDYQTRDDFGA